MKDHGSCMRVAIALASCACTLTYTHGSARAGDDPSITITAPTVAEFVDEGGKQKEYQRLWSDEPLEARVVGPMLMVVKVRASAGKGASGQLTLKIIRDNMLSAERAFSLDISRGTRYSEREKIYISAPGGEHTFRFEATSGTGAVRLAKTKKSKDDPEVTARMLTLTGAEELIASPVAGGAAPGTGTVVVAIAPFKNFSLDPRYDAYAGAVPGQLVSVLSRSTRLKVVERDALNQAMNEMALAQSGIVDPSTAQELGRVLGAQYLIAGGVAVFEDSVRIDARLINVSTGQAIGKSGVAGKDSEISSAVEDLGAKLLLHITGEDLFPDRYERKSTWAAGLLSVFPGGGQYYNERYVKGAVVTGFGAAAVGAVLVTHKAYIDKYNAYKESDGTKSQRDDLFDKAEKLQIVRNVLIGVAAAIEVFSIYDAISEAIQDNEEIDRRLAGHRPDGKLRLTVLPHGGAVIGFSSSF